jgi:hypothetical protein
MKTPCFALLVNYVESYMSWEYIKDDDELEFITNRLMGNPDPEQWDAYYPQGYKDAFVVDADELLILRKTLGECVDVAFRTTEDQVLARYVDNLQSEDTLFNVSFNQFVKPYLDELTKIYKSEEFSKPELKSYVNRYSD